jgi:glycosyltransferase involved in cell wall biosynthesis
MKTKPRVSIIMATWCRPGYIGKAIESVIAQTFQDWELIIVDDGSSDNTSEVVAPWLIKDDRIRYIRLEHTGKISAVSNAGLHAATGEFVAILDDDDYWRDSEKLMRQIDFLDKNPEYAGCGSGIVIIDKENKETGRARKPERDEDIRRLALLANPIANSSSIFRRSLAGEYDEKLPQLADWDFWLTLLQKGKFYNFQEYFLAYRIWDSSRSFLRQRELARSARAVVLRHKNEYVGFSKAIILANCYLAYSYLPAGLRRRMNAFLSRLKKRLFSH